MISIITLKILPIVSPSKAVAKSKLNKPNSIQSLNVSPI